MFATLSFLNTTRAYHDLEKKTKALGRRIGTMDGRGYAVEMISAHKPVTDKYKHYQPESLDGSSAGHCEIRDGQGWFFSLHD
jgi:hypothetical protein